MKKLQGIIYKIFFVFVFVLHTVYWLRGLVDFFDKFWSSVSNEILLP